MGEAAPFQWTRNRYPFDQIRQPMFLPNFLSLKNPIGLDCA